jgi:metallo-beta-lactamase family protein
MAKLTFYGATEGVTGSAYLLETGHTTVLLECGLVHGSREEEKANAAPFPFDINKLDMVRCI